METKGHILVVIQGPTASGKTALAVQVAKQLNTEVISADSRQFYRELQIGTARPLPEELEGVPHHFLGSHSLFEPLTAAAFAREASECLQRIFARQKYAVLVGGSGMFIDALCYGLDALPHDAAIREQLNQQLEEDGLELLLAELEQADPTFYAQVDRHNPPRIIRALEVIRITGKPFSGQRTRQKQEQTFRQLRVVIDLPREVLYQRINERVTQMLEQGLEQEAMQFFDHRSLPALQTVGYSEYYKAAQQQQSFAEVPDLIRQHTRNYAKRQLTWFRRDPENHWLKAQTTAAQQAEIINLLNQLSKEQN